MHAVDLVIVAAYLAIVLLLGRRSKKAARSEENFFLAGRTLGKLRQFFFNFGHSTDANTAVSTVSFVYEGGASAAWLQLQMIFLNPYYWFMNTWFRRVRLLTVAELIEERMESRRLGQVYALFQIGVAIMGIGYSNFVAYKVTAALTKGSPALAPASFYAVYVAIVGIYVSSGGLEATVLIQIFQGLLVLAFSVILLPFGWRFLGAGGLHGNLPPHMFDILAAGDSGVFTGWAVLAVLAVSLVQINANVVNMALAGSARDESAARFGAVAGTYGKRIMIVLWVFVGLIAASIYQGADRLADPDLAWGALSRKLLGPGFIGLMLVGLLAANMASIATKTLAIAALFVRNLYRPYSGRSDEAQEVRVGRIASGVALACSVAAALAMKETFAVTKLILTVNIPFGAAVLLMFFWRRLTAAAIWMCLLLSGSLILVAPLVARVAGSGGFCTENWILSATGIPLSGCSLGGRLAAEFFFDALFPFAVLVAVSLFTRSPSAATVEQFFGKMKTPVGATPDLDVEAMEETRRNPNRFAMSRLFPGSSWEFTRWDRNDSIGFLACCAISAAIIGVFWLALREVR